MPVRTAGAQGGLAIALGAEEVAAHAFSQAKRGDMHKSQPAPSARSRERSGPEVVHALVGFVATRTEDADAVHHRVAAVQDATPVRRLRCAIHPHFAPAIGVLAMPMPRG